MPRNVAFLCAGTLREPNSCLVSLEVCRTKCTHNTGSKYEACLAADEAEVAVGAGLVEAGRLLNALEERLEHGAPVLQQNPQFAAQMIMLRAMESGTNPLVYFCASALQWHAVNKTRICRPADLKNLFAGAQFLSNDRIPSSCRNIAGHPIACIYQGPCTRPAALKALETSAFTIKSPCACLVPL